MSVQEVNFDGLVGPTHHFGGLGVGNLASRTHGGQVARPRAAALAGIRKMRVVAELGAAQYVLPPQRRPDLRFLKRIGFSGNSEQILASAYRKSPHMLSAAWSASAMWAANAATVSAAADCRDNRVHLSVANLTSSIHRSIEPRQTLRLLRRMFWHPDFVVHAPLPATWGLRDEGAANHMRLSDHWGHRGIELFVFGDAEEAEGRADLAFPARQSLAASQALARRHQCSHALMLRQSPKAIAAGAFHNDVVATSCRNVLLLHEHAFADPNAVDQVATVYREQCGLPLHMGMVSEQDLSLDEAIATYLFNSQLIASAAGPEAAMTIVCPQQVAESVAAERIIRRWINDEGPICNVVYVELRESMNNGGGPACLRLRVPMSESQRQSLPAEQRFDETLETKLERIVEQTYPEQIELADLSDPALLAHATASHEAVCRALGMPAN